MNHHNYNLFLMMYLGPQFCGRVRAVILGVLVGISFASQSHAERTELDLGGTWQYQNVSQLTYPPTNNWQTMYRARLSFRLAIPARVVSHHLCLAVRHGRHAAQTQIWRREI